LSPSAVKESLSMDLMNRIRQIMPVTPAALMAMALLSFRRTPVAVDSVCRKGDVYLNYLETRQIVLARSLKTGADLKTTFLDALEFFGSVDTVELRFHGDADNRCSEVAVRPKDRLKLDYLKNSLMGLYLPVSLTAFAKLATQSDEHLRSRTQWLIHMICPQLHPFPTESMIPELEQCETIIHDYSHEECMDLAVLMFPVLLTLAEIWPKLAKYGDVHWTRKDYKDKLMQIIPSVPAAGEFPEISTTRTVNALATILMKSGPFEPDGAGRLVVTSEQYARWTDFSQTCLDLHNRWDEPIQ